MHTLLLRHTTHRRGTHSAVISRFADSVFSLLHSTDKVVCEVLNSGAIGNNKGVNLPGIAVDLPSVTAKDVSDLRFGAEVLGVDFIAASFVRKAVDVRAIREAMGPKGKGIKVIAKIESQEGLDNFDEVTS